MPRSGGEFPGQSLADHHAGLGNAVKRNEGTEARTFFLTEKQLIESGEPGDRDTRTAIRPLLVVVLIPLDCAGHVQNSILDCCSIGTGRQFRKLCVQRLQRAAFNIVRRLERFVRLDEIIEVADRETGQTVQMRMVFRRHPRCIAGDERPEHLLGFPRLKRTQG